MRRWSRFFSRFVFDKACGDFLVDLNKLRDEVKESLSFDLPPTLSRASQEFSLILELKRQGATLRSTVRVRRAPTQLTLPLHDNQLSLFAEDNNPV